MINMRNINYFFLQRSKSAQSILNDFEPSRSIITHTYFISMIMLYVTGHISHLDRKCFEK